MSKETKIYRSRYKDLESFAKKIWELVALEIHNVTTIDFCIGATIGGIRNEDGSFDTIDIPRYVENVHAALRAVRNKTSDSKGKQLEYRDALLSYYPTKIDPPGLPIEIVEVYRWLEHECQFPALVRCVALLSCLHPFETRNNEAYKIVWKIEDDL